MALRVSDILKLKGLSGLKLEAGAAGLDNYVASAGILDYEYVSNAGRLPNPLFNEGSFIISSLLFAKDDPSLLLPAVQQLVAAGVSALAYKSIFYEEMPVELIRYADEYSLPIFRFNQGTYFEDIIFEIMDAVQQDDTQVLTNSRIQYILSNPITPSEASDLCRGLSLKFRRFVQAAYIKNRPGQPALNIQRLLRSYYHSKSLREKVMLGHYDGGLFLLMTASGSVHGTFRAIFQEYMDTSGIDPKLATVSFSEIHESKNHLPQCIRESYWAHRAALAEKRSNLHYSASGVWQYLVPLSDQQALSDFSERMLSGLEEKPDLLETACVWVQTGGDLSQTAEVLCCHPNTIRYRLQRIHQLTGDESAIGRTDFQLYEQLSAALKIKDLGQI